MCTTIVFARHRRVCAVAIVVVVLAAVLLASIAPAHASRVATSSSSPSSSATDVTDDDDTVPRVLQQYTLYVDALPRTADDDGYDVNGHARTTSPLLVSVEADVTLTLPSPPRASSTAADDGNVYKDNAHKVKAHKDNAHAHEHSPNDSNDESLSFPEGFDALWYFAALRRGVHRLGWTGCGGQWRRGWSVAQPHSRDTEEEEDSDGDTHEEGTDGGATAALQRLRHALAHHVVCSTSSLSLCGVAARPAFATAAQQFQWAAQLVSALTSSPLSWTGATPRHIRPVGVLVALPQHAQQSTHNNKDSSDSSEDEVTPSWCSFHAVHHDVLCTQHVTHWLDSGRAQHDVVEVMPAGIFHAAVRSYALLLATPFHHFDVRLSRHPRAVRLRMRMSLVTTDAAHMRELQQLWGSNDTTHSPSSSSSSSGSSSGRHSRRTTLATLQSFAQRGLLRVHVGHGVRAIEQEQKQQRRRHHRRARVAGGDDVDDNNDDDGDDNDDDGGGAKLPRGLLRVIRDLQRQHAAHARTAARPAQLHVAVAEQQQQQQQQQPEVVYTVTSHGSDHAYLTLQLQPFALVTRAADVPVRDATAAVQQQQQQQRVPALDSTHATTWWQPRAGDEVYTLLLFPLHLLRPVLHSIESVRGGTTTAGVHVDTTTNTLAVLLHSRLTHTHEQLYNAAFARSNNTNNDNNNSRNSGSGATAAAAAATPATDDDDGEGGVLLARMQLLHGWTALHEMPRDDNSFRIMPQPLVLLLRPQRAHKHAPPQQQREKKDDDVDDDGVCSLSCVAAAATASAMDHSEALAHMMHAILQSRHRRIERTHDNATSSSPACACAAHWLRAVSVSGSMIPAPDPAMLLNALALWGVTFTILAGLFYRNVHRLTCAWRDRHADVALWLAADERVLPGKARLA